MALQVSWWSYPEFLENLKEDVATAVQLEELVKRMGPATAP